MARTKTKKVNYHFKPPLGLIASNTKALARMKLEKVVIDNKLKGFSLEDIAIMNGITEQEAHKITVQAITKWAGPLSHSAADAREIDLQRLDKLLLQLHPYVFPEPYIDNETGALTMPPIDAAATRLYLDTLERRAKLLGTDAAHKLEAQRNEILKRHYIGVGVNDKGEIDL